MVAVKGGTLLIVAGVWVLAQLFGGNALGRLGITNGGPAFLGKKLPQGPQSGGGAGGGGGGSF